MACPIFCFFFLLRNPEATEESGDIKKQLCFLFELWKIEVSLIWFSTELFLFLKCDAHNLIGFKLGWNMKNKTKQSTIQVTYNLLEYNREYLQCKTIKMKKKNYNNKTKSSRKTLFHFSYLREKKKNKRNLELMYYANSHCMSHTKTIIKSSTIES